MGQEWAIIGVVEFGAVLWAIEKVRYFVFSAFNVSILFRNQSDTTLNPDYACIKTSLQLLALNRRTVSSAKVMILPVGRGSKPRSFM